MPSYSQALETPLIVSGCNWQGCYDDNGGVKALNPRVLGDSRDTMTIELCVGECLRLGYVFAGLEYGSECYCGPEISPPHAPVYGNTSTEDIIITCSNPEFSCRGNRLQMCGGFAAIGIYSCPANNPVTTTVRISCLKKQSEQFYPSSFCSDVQRPLFTLKYRDWQNCSLTSSQTVTTTTTTST
jgi:hypothetical protein